MGKKNTAPVTSIRNKSDANAFARQLSSSFSVKAGNMSIYFQASGNGVPSAYEKCGSMTEMFDQPRCIANGVDAVASVIWKYRDKINREVFGCGRKGAKRNDEYRSLSDYFGF